MARSRYSVKSFHCGSALPGMNGGDNDFGVLTCSTIIGAQVEVRFSGFDPGQYQWPAALGARRSKILDELEIQSVHGRLRKPQSGRKGETIPHRRSKKPPLVVQRRFVRFSVAVRWV